MGEARRRGNRERRIEQSIDRREQEERARQAERARREEERRARIASLPPEERKKVLLADGYAAVAAPFRMKKP